MSEEPSLESKLYKDAGGREVSVRDLLDYFSARGTMRVSDLHLKAGCPPVYRVDGDLNFMDGPPLDADTVEAMASVLISESEMAALRGEGAVDSSLFTEAMQFRINCFRENEGLAVAVRALEPKPIDVEEIGFPNSVWQDIVTRQWGLVLVTGITGAGKSTTIASMIDRISRTRPVRIITLEDPIEYRLRSSKGIVSQREVGRDVPDFARGLRDCLREDPDVIFVGEMRDRESAAWTLTAAETGHLVFSTLHTRDARGTITRILDMFPESRQDEVANQLSLGLSHIISQKLVPRCDAKGRVAAMEILNNTYAMANLIRLRKVEQVYSHLQTRTKDIPTERMVTLERSLAELVAEGRITALEAAKWANDPNAFAGEIQHLSRQMS
ncbi:MAG: type IV pilus twitching motility protein PilT [Planctomycetota bacterium]|jgi:twitching motility protein PilT